MKIYYGGNILTMTGAEKRPEAVLIEEERILYVGSLYQAEALGGENAERINLHGKTLMPAFVDSHSHFTQVAQNILMCDLSEAECFADIAAALRAYIAENKVKEDEVIFAGGYDHNFLLEDRHPDCTLLDQVSGQIPIYISHVSGHMGVANSAMLRLAGITADMPDPAGGRFGRNADGTLNGYIEETPAIMRVLGAALPRLKTDMERQLQMAQQMYLENGITTVQEGAAMGQGVQMLVQYAQSGKLKLDVVMYIMDDSYREDCRRFPEYCGSYREHLKIGGAKIILDGSPQGKSAWLSRPYAGEEQYCGYPTHEDDYVDAAARNAVKGDYQLLAHCNGDAASEQFLDSYEKALKSESNPNMDLRPVMIHCQTVRPDQLDRMKKLRMIPSVFIGHTYYWGDVHLKNLGPCRGARISPLKSMLERGLIYNLHQDSPVTKPDMLHSVWCAVNRVTRKGNQIGPEERIGVFEALKGVTINAAYAYHEEDIKGTLETGKQADMIILDANPLEVDKMRIKDICVLETIKAGKTLYRKTV